MKSIKENIELIITDLIDSSKKLSEILFKVKLVSFQLGNEELKQWVELELNGYDGSSVIPEYRKVHSNISATLLKDNGYHGRERITGYSVPLDLIPAELKEFFYDRPMFNSISDIEYIINSGHVPSFQYPVDLIHLVQSKMNSNVAVETLSLNVEINQLESILTSVRSKVLSYFSELNYSDIDLKNFNMAHNKSKLDNLFSKNFEAENINISIGDNNQIGANSGSGTLNNTVNNFQFHKENLETILNEISSKIDELGLDGDSKLDVQDEIVRINKQLKREHSNNQIVNSSVDVIKNILLSVTANAYTPIILDKLSSIFN